MVLAYSQLSGRPNSKAMSSETFSQLKLSSEFLICKSALSWYFKVAGFQSCVLAMNHCFMLYNLSHVSLLVALTPERYSCF